MLQPHIHLDETLKLRYAILPGDPARVERIAQHLDSARELASNREYRSMTGSYRGVPILAMSTGMGGPSTAIAVEELRAIGITHAIRIGSCGALAAGIGLGELLLASGAVRDDGTSKTYIPPQYPAVPDLELLLACRESAAARGLTQHLGLVRSHDSFYIDHEDEVSRYWSARGILGSDMETATLFTVGRLRGLKTASILNNVVLWGQDTADAIGDYATGEALTAEGERNEILVALDALARMEESK